MIGERSRPPRELVWVLDHVDRATIRRGRRLVVRGRAAEDPETARVAMAIAHQAEAKALGAGGAFVTVMFCLVALSWCYAGDGPAQGTLARALTGGLGVWLPVGAAWQDRVARTGAPRAETVNRAFLKASGSPYARLPEGAGIRIAPVGLVAVFLAYVLPLAAASGLLIDAINHRGQPGIGTLLVDGAPLAIVIAANTAWRSRRGWRPDRRPATRWSPRV